MRCVAGSALRVYAALQERPVTTAAALTRTGLSLPAVNNALVALTNAGIVCDLAGRRRNRIFSYDAYLRILSEGTEPLRDRDTRSAERRAPARAPSPARPSTRP